MIAERLGHENVKETMNTYIHLFESYHSSIMKVSNKRVYKHVTLFLNEKHYEKIVNSAFPVVYLRENIYQNKKRDHR